MTEENKSWVDGPVRDEQPITDHPIDDATPTNGGVELSALDRRFINHPDALELAEEHEHCGCRLCQAARRRRDIKIEAQAPEKEDPHNDPNYRGLESVLRRAYYQAARGKGAQRHGQSLPFEQQPMLRISRVLGSNTGLLYQAAKKAQESQRLERDAAVFELLGAINYLAGAVIFLEEADVD